MEGAVVGALGHIVPFHFPTNHDSKLSDAPNNRVQLVAWVGWQALTPPSLTSLPLPSPPLEKIKNFLTHSGPTNLINSARY